MRTDKISQNPQSNNNRQTAAATGGAVAATASFGRFKRFANSIQGGDKYVKNAREAYEVIQKPAKGFQRIFKFFRPNITAAKNNVLNKFTKIAERCKNLKPVKFLMTSKLAKGVAGVFGVGAALAALISGGTEIVKATAKDANKMNAKYNFVPGVDFEKDLNGYDKAA
jgi:hypothetical protein